MKKYLNQIWNGIIPENPALRLLFGNCPTLAVSIAAMNGVFMGIAAGFVLIGSNLLISLLRKSTPERIRIPIFVVVIATFTTIADMALNAFAPDMHKILGVFIPLIVVNCIIFARAEAFAYKNGPLLSVADGVGMGIGYTLAITTLAGIRELFGTGKLFGVQLLGAWFKPFAVLTMPPGGYITLGCLIATMNVVMSYFEDRALRRAPARAAVAAAVEEA
jgi:electron transport complex protein RnfE